MTDELMDLFKHNADQTLAQCRRDLEALVKRMQQLEGGIPPTEDCYTYVYTCLLSVVERMQRVINCSHHMAKREVTGIKPELN